MKSRKRNKILLCSPLDLSFGSGIARWANHIQDYYKEHRSPVVDMSVYPMDRSMYLDETANVIKRAYLGIKDYYKIVRGICKKVINDNYDIVHIASSASISLVKDLFLLRKLHRYGVQTIIHFHFGRIPQLYMSQNWEWKLIRRVIKLATKVVVIDKLSYDTLLNAGFDNIFLLPNPLTPQINDVIVRDKDVSREKKDVLFVGHVYKTKGVYELVDACAQIPDIHLKIVGKYEDNVKSELLAISSKKEQESWVEFTGNLSFEEVVKEMLSCGIFVLPTYTEGFPNVILESMACGCPIVTTNVGAIPEMLDVENGMQNGICVEPQQVEPLKNAILRMLEDKEYAQKCGENAQYRVNAMYSMPTVWNKLVDIWRC